MIMLFHIVQIAVCFTFIGWSLGRIAEMMKEERRAEEQRTRQSCPKNQEAWRKEMQRVIGEAFIDRETTR